MTLCDIHKAKRKDVVGGSTFKMESKSNVAVDINGQEVLVALAVGIKSDGKDLCRECFIEALKQLDIVKLVEEATEAPPPKRKA